MVSFHGRRVVGERDGEDVADDDLERDHRERECDRDRERDGEGEERASPDSGEDDRNGGCRRPLCAEAGANGDGDSDDGDGRGNVDRGTTGGADCDCGAVVIVVCIGKRHTLADINRIAMSLTLPSPHKTLSDVRWQPE
jgi:hypothetical protein